MARRHPEDLPWTALDLSAPIGAFTGRKLAGLAEDAPRCRALLAEAGVRFVALPSHRPSPHCGYNDGVRFAPGAGDARSIAYRSADLDISCAVAAALAVWEWRVVQPAALEAFGQRVAEIEHLGSYACRRLYGASEGRWSAHATADAVDIAAFVLEDGRRISVLGGWSGDADEARFLRAARDGACDLFATTLSPDYNAAHADHLHLDQAKRGAIGWRACR
ncbi:MAG: extensin family protein [Sphingomonadaceae bacterium]|nr:extensin family protein [Sphingomonadaceae bacterium]